MGGPVGAMPDSGVRLGVWAPVAGQEESLGPGVAVGGDHL